MNFEVVIKSNGKEVQARVIDKIIVGYPAYSRTEYIVQWVSRNELRHKVVDPKVDVIKFIPIEK